MHARQAERRIPILSWALVRVLVLLFIPAACAPRSTLLPEIGSTSVPQPSVPSATSRQPAISSSPDPTAASDCGTGRIDSLNLPTTHLPSLLHASIYLPPCYAEHTGLRYPVLYLFHGLTYTDDQWIRLGAPKTADRLILSGEIPAMILVMPYDPSWQEPTEYGFAEAVTQDLVPAIDTLYRTLPDRSHRAVGGLSRGAGWAIRLGLTRPDLFGAIGAHSVIVFGTDGMLVPNWLAAIPPSSVPRIYLDIGDNDAGLPSARILEEMLTQADVPHEWHLNTGFHDEAYWSAHVEEYLRWYAAGW